MTPRKGGERRIIELSEQVAAISSAAARRSIVQLDNERADRLVEGGGGGHSATRSLPPSSRPAFIPVQLEGKAERELSRKDSVATVDLPACVNRSTRELSRQPDIAAPDGGPSHRYRCRQGSSAIAPSSALLDPLPKEVRRNGRRRYEAASKERLVTACLEPGVSVSRLALEHGVNATSTLGSPVRFIGFLNLNRTDAAVGTHCCAAGGEPSTRRPRRQARGRTGAGTPASFCAAQRKAC
ncbi:hypothetical protein ABIB95_008748 [Bradyrhizobium sp. LA2.1]